MNYLKQNHLSLLIAAFLVISSFFGSSVPSFGAAANVTTVGNPWVFTNTVTYSGAMTLTSALTAVTGTFSGLLKTDSGELHSYTSATSTVASMTLKLSDINGFDTVIVTPTGAAADKTLTFFASSTASTWLPTAGDTQNTCILNATSTAATTLTIAGGTGIDLRTASSSAAVLGSNLLTIPAGSGACFKFVREAATASAFDIMVLMTRYAL